MTSPGQPMTTSQSRELVPRRPLRDDTLSQRELQQRAAAGDLQARLDLIPLDVVEDQLSRSFRTAQPECSILTFLKGGDDALPGYRAAKVVLEELADATEHVALTSAFVFRYVKERGLWRGHPDDNVSSAEAFLETLDNSDYVRANIAIGSSADLSKQRSVKAISAAWGHDWFEQIPHTLKDPRWTRAEECSKRLLAQMTVSTRRGCTLERAIDHWTRSMQRRTDESARDKFHIDLPRSPYIILDDVRSLNEEVNEATNGTLSDSQEDDRVRVELVPAVAPSPAPPTKPAQASRKRKRPSRVVEELAGSEDESGEDDGWRVVDGGKAKVKRVGNCLIHKPVEEAPAELASSEEHGITQLSDTQLEIPSTPERGSSPPATREPALRKAVRYRHPTCDGPGVALMLHKLVDALSEMPTLEDFPGARHRCCDICRPKALRAFRVVTEVLLPCAEDLEKITQHHFAGHEIVPSQISDISPHKHGTGQSQSLLFVGSLSNVD